MSRETEVNLQRRKIIKRFLEKLKVLDKVTDTNFREKDLLYKNQKYEK